MTTDDKDKIIELHEKIEKLDSERDNLKVKLSKQTTWYKNPAMITALTGMLAGIGTTAENIYSRWQKAQQRQKEEKIESKTNSAAIEFLLDRQDKVENTCIKYTNAIMEAMSLYQRRKVENYLEKHSSEEEPEVSVYERDRVQPREDATSFEETSDNSRASTARESSQEEPIKANRDMYQVIQEQVQKKGSPDFKELNKMVEDRKQEQL